jgi:hypothetical protein
MANKNEKQHLCDELIINYKGEVEEDINLS